MLGHPQCLEVSIAITLYTMYNQFWHSLSDYFQMDLVNEKDSLKMLVYLQIR